MGGSEELTLSTINEYLQSLKGKLSDDSTVTVIKFDSGYVSRPAFGAGVAPGAIGVNIVTLLDKTDLKTLRTLTRADYAPNGGTPLHDAIGHTIKLLDDAEKVRPGPVFMAVITDGFENASQEYALPAIKKMIEERVGKGWTCSFLAVDIDAYSTGGAMGFRQSDSVSLSRGSFKGSAAPLTASTLRKTAAYTAAYGASGGNVAATSVLYAASTQAEYTFSDEDKTSLETTTGGTVTGRTPSKTTRRPSTPK